MNGSAFARIDDLPAAQRVPGRSRCP